MEKSAIALMLTFVALMLCLTSRECHAWTFSVTPNRVINYGNLRLYFLKISCLVLYCDNFNHISSPFHIHPSIHPPDNVESNGPTFHSNGSYFKLLHMDDKSVLIGAR